MRNRPQHTGFQVVRGENDRQEKRDLSSGTGPVFVGIKSISHLSALINVVKVGGVAEGGETIYLLILAIHHFLFELIFITHLIVTSVT